MNFILQRKTHNTVLSAVAATLLIVSTSSFAEAPCKAKHKPLNKQKIETMKKRLDLSPEQVTQIKALRKNYRLEQKESAATRVKYKRLLNPGDDNYMSLVQAQADQAGAIATQKILAKGQLKADVYALLTPEQKDKSQKIRAKRLTQ
jgi:Spy/CpxP family protein refolding chaperone